MTLARRAETPLGVFCAILLGGILGLLWWWRRHSLGYHPVGRFRRVRAVLLVAALVTIAVGAVWRLAIAIQSVPGCSPPGGALAVRDRASLSASLVAEEAATWPETGIGLLYAKADDGRVCLSTSSDYYVGVPAAVAGARATNMGDVVLSPGFDNSEERTAVASHEARHRPQWAIATAIGGPFAFPVAYAIDDFFFPGSRNHFERLAGLKTGLYSEAGTGPVLGPAQIATLAVLAAIVVVVLFRVLRRRRSDTSGAGQSEAESGEGSAA
jgi:hypothetical protein